jgi:hypothetical protein
MQISIGRRARRRGWTVAVGRDAHDQSDEWADKSLSIARVHAQQGSGNVPQLGVGSTDSLVHDRSSITTCGLETTRRYTHGVTLAITTIIGSDGIARQGDDVDRAKKPRKIYVSVLSNHPSRACSSYTNGSNSLAAWRSPRVIACRIRETSPSPPAMRLTPGYHHDRT